MKKNNEILLIMKLSIIFMVVFSLNLSAKGFDQFSVIAEGEKAVQNNPNGIEQFVPQQLMVEGTVTNENGEPFPGVNVLIEGTSTGTSTDINGKYSIVKPSDNVILVFSFIGYKPQKVSAGGKTIVDITMVTSTSTLDEVVVIGYGTTRRRDLTGSVSSVQNVNLRDVPVTSAADVLVGKMAGVVVSRTEGDPSADINIRIRGGGSITQDNSPLYIVDGFPVNNIKDIPPTDIASVDILKDASSTAIYGARGANGVVLINTKKGTVGVGKVNYNAYIGVKKPEKLLDVMDPYNFVLWQFEALGKATTEPYFGDFKDIDLYKEMKGTNWQEECLPGGSSLYNNLSFSGGTKKTKYLISLTRNDEKEIMITSDYTRTNVMANLTQEVNNWLTVDLNTSLSDYRLNGNIVSGTNVVGRMTNIIQYKPVNGLQEFVNDELVDPETFTAYNIYIIDPVENMNQDYRKKNSLTIRVNGSAAIKLSKSLTYRFQYGQNYVIENEDKYYGLATYYGRVDGAPRAYKMPSSATSNRITNTLTYQKSNFIPGNNLNVLLGEELFSSKYSSVTSTVRFLPNIDIVDALNMMQLGAPEPISVANSPSEKLSSFFGRLNYDYRQKYMVTATLRADGSNKFAPGKRWGIFPSIGLAWLVSNEKFMAATKPWLNDLKLRLSYGEAGNNRVSDYSYAKTFSVTTSTLYLGETTVPTPFVALNSILGNQKLKWETTITKNLGLDFSLIKNRLSGSIELYQNTTKDLLIKATIPASVGYSTQWQNLGQTTNKGIELTLNGIIISQENFQLTTSFNIAFNRNRIDKLGEVKRWEENAAWGSSYGAVNDFLVEEGGQVGEMYGYVTEGMYSFDDFDYNPTTKKYTLKTGVATDEAEIGASWFGPGALKLKDQNDDGIIDAKDKVVIGNVNPKHTGGFNLTAAYKGFDLSTYFNWSYGNNTYNASKLVWGIWFYSWPYRNMLKFNETRFTTISPETGEKVTDPTELAELNKNATIWSPYYRYGRLHSWAIEDGSFLRLNSLTIGYNLPKKLINKIRIEKLRIYATGYNLWLWTNYSGSDPEVNCRRTTPLTPGVDYNAYPRARSLNVGLNVEF